MMDNLSETLMFDQQFAFVDHMPSRIKADHLYSLYLESINRDMIEI